MTGINHNASHTYPPDRVVLRMASALHTTFQIPEGVGLCQALGAPNCDNNREALVHWVEQQVDQLEPAVWTAVMSQLVGELDEVLRREEKRSWL
ncbi:MULTISPECIES: hypothetical protein [Ectothiorhodospira]|uniref:hypothetical protein n=1 Tax=Ectothiorhodospira TaxID=1051 RepID=UPI001EE937F4|nr:MULTISPECIES: hypothetical protein [Ectothiorhodospira]MCG5495965.1 hypothetical protein [Ectothiorhodospira variabilis]MCG5498508.1 hypothetical protein [Ectothiorhodospira variabilis]MCG5505321.1 hypothetical protein [Ectothiorhodospira variabilis]MCG5508507.1 hypothetical protein [Ectothiorhodospira variabilis]MCG5525927.1 hypothetical protein [Ectothiorhodospira haloalkaliphila]